MLKWSQAKAYTADHVPAKATQAGRGMPDAFARVLAPFLLPFPGQLFRKGSKKCGVWGILQNVLSVKFRKAPPTSTKPLGQTRTLAGLHAPCNRIRNAGLEPCTAANILCRNRFMHEAFLSRNYNYIKDHKEGNYRLY